MGPSDAWMAANMLWRWSAGSTAWARCTSCSHLCHKLLTRGRPHHAAAGQGPRTHIDGVHVPKGWSPAGTGTGFPSLNRSHCATDALLPKLNSTCHSSSACTRSMWNSQASLHPPRQTDPATAVIGLQQHLPACARHFSSARPDPIPSSSSTPFGDPSSACNQAPRPSSTAEHPDHQVNDSASNGAGASATGRANPLDHVTDMRRPARWYPQARALRRKIIAHLGPTNSGKISGKIPLAGCGCGDGVAVVA